MFKIVLLTATALVLVSARSAGEAAVRSPSNESGLAPRTAKVLWNQNSNYANNGVNSMNFSSGTSYNDQAADDFVIPKGRTWRITEVDVTGVYYSGSGPAASENVIFYRNAAGIPGNQIARGTFTNLQGSGTGGNFAIVLPSGGVRLGGGHYWVSIIANIWDFENGEWAWNMNSVQHKNPAVWRNPGGGWNLCRTWCTLENVGLHGPDLMFALKGVSGNE